MKTMVVIQNSHSGLLAEITGLLAENSIEVNDCSGDVLGHTAIVRLQATPYRKAFRTLSAAGYHVYASATLLLRVEQRHGALAHLSRRLADAGVDIRGLHFVDRDGSAGVIALETADQDKAKDLLADMLI